MTKQKYMTIICIDPECCGCTTYAGHRWTGTMWVTREGKPQEHSISVVRAQYRNAPSFDAISKPQHYIFSKPANDVLDVLKEAGFNMGDHYIASALAYGFRCKKKNGGKDYLQDLKKMAFYINKAIELYEADERSNTNDE